MKYLDVRDPNTNKLLFRFDPTRDLIELKQRGTTTLIDLKAIREANSTSDTPQQPK